MIKAKVLDNQISIIQHYKNFLIPFPLAEQKSIVEKVDAKYVG
ncbi:hypothetical protein [Tepidimicrobium xylanilyticum]|uniref:Uncharacterized protein n=1 Tax=Tepidimicrobium xylanilyticum TaxID=1123352 RepID=A0A1H2WT42_9FIRM|nr:hypothetical protein [Tepidimicrobium xylanilyticum]SDW83843.1 hypothetical protein SAMN05660923_01338 [Tepidimicrobium xylanilyticum]